MSDQSLDVVDLAGANGVDERGDAGVVWSERREMRCAASKNVRSGPDANFGSDNADESESQY